MEDLLKFIEGHPLIGMWIIVASSTLVTMVLVGILKIVEVFWPEIIWSRNSNLETRQEGN